MTHTAATRYYRPAFGANPGNLPARLRAAYALAGKTPPALMAPAEAALDDEPTPEEIGARVAQAALDERADWLEESIAAMTRALAVAEVRKAASRYREHTLKRASRRLSAAAAADVAGTFGKVATALGKAARDLPRANPLDPGAVVEADATRAWKAAQAALADVGVLASIHEPQGASSVGPAVASLLRVVAVPAITEPQTIHRLTRAAVGDVDPRRTQVREFATAAERSGLGARVGKGKRSRRWSRVDHQASSVGIRRMGLCWSPERRCVARRIGRALCPGGASPRAGPGQVVWRVDRPPVPRCW